MWVWMNGVSTKLERGWIYCHARSRIVILNRSLFIIFVLNREPEGFLWWNPIYALVDVYFFHYLFRSWVDDEAITHTIFSYSLSNVSFGWKLKDFSENKDYESFLVSDWCCSGTTSNTLMELCSQIGRKSLIRTGAFIKRITTMRYDFN